VTEPDVRLQGIGATMTLAALHEARALGYRVSVLRASPYGLHLYRRLGFREYCLLSTYVWSPQDAP
jgi:ribosomal protein S18 acetylase RimI-like enzyme